MKTFSTSGVFAIVLVLTAALTVVVRAPAAWLGDVLETRSTVRLVDARGTIWNGSALVGFSNGREITLVPGRVQWTVDRITGSAVTATLAHAWLTAPVRLSLGREGLGFGKGAARVPAGVLASAGAPFNTLRPGGTLEASWSDGVVRNTGLNGEVQIDWRDAKSALSTVAPLGSYRLKVSGNGGGPSLDLVTLAGPLEIQGKGKMEGSRIRFNGTAGAEPGMRPALNGLLGVLGMRSGDKVLLAIDT